MAMEAIIHKKIDSLEKLLPKWKKLKEEFLEITVFQEIGWIKNCWDYLNKQENITPYIVEIRKDDRTIGIIPLYCSLEKFVNLNFRILKPIGTEYSDYLIPILSKEYSPEKQINTALETILADKSSWDCINWKDIPEKSVFDNVLNKLLLEKPLLLQREKIDVCPFLILNDDVEKVKRNFGKKHLNGILYKERRLKKEGNLEFRKVLSEHEIEPVMNKLFELHCERWKDTETPSDFRRLEEREYFIQAAKNLFKNNLLYLAYLVFNNKEIMVVHFGMSDKKRNYLYLHAINMKFKKYSVGNILAYNIILDACKEGYEIVDFLKGDEEYKKKWGTENRFNVKYVIFNTSIKSWLYKMVWGTYHSKKINGKSAIRRTFSKLVVRGLAFVYSISNKLKFV